MMDKYIPSILLKFNFILFILFISGSLLAQNPPFLEHNWYFGDSPYGMIFSKGTNQAETVMNQNTAFLYGRGGGGVATDRQTGELLFYTDGNNVYDNSHQRMPNGFGLSANPLGNQHVAILPVPNQPDQYYIITNTVTLGLPGALFYSIVDMSQDGNGGSPQPPRGNVTVKNIPIGIANSSEALLAFHTGNDPFQYWILVQQFNSTTFELYEVTAGNTFTLRSSANVPVSMIAANFSAHYPSGKIAVSPLSTGANVTLLDFDPVAQTIAYDTVILNTGNNDTGNYAIYDTEWSPDGTKLYVSRTGAGDGITLGSVTVFDINLPLQSGQAVASNLNISYGLKRGPDNNIYHLYRDIAAGPLLMGRIENADTLAPTMVYVPNYFAGIDFDSRQFPEFSPPPSDIVTNIGFDFVGTCQGNTTKFFPTIAPQATQFTWDFGDGTSAVYNSFIAPIHQYQGPGTYDVTMTATVNGNDTTFLQQVTINQSDSVDLGADTVICPGEILTLDAGPNGQSYRWSVPGETGQTIDVDSAGTYWVVVDYGTCESYDEIMVEVYGAQDQFANLWYFGNNAGIDFNGGAPTATSDGATQAPAGVTAYSDANGDIVLYSDGTTIYSRDHLVVGNNIGGSNNATQSSLIIPFPNDPTMFYVFTTEDIWDPIDQSYILNYAIYDMKKLGDPSGPVVLDNKTLYYRTTERLAGLLGANTWMLSHEFGTNTFRSYPITQDGINDPVFSTVGSVHGTSNNQTGEGYMQFDPTGQKVAVALVSEGNENLVELFDFDQQTGILSNPIQLTFPESPGVAQVYGVEFSPGGTELYVSLTGATSSLYEFKLYYDIQDSVQNSRQLLAQGNQQLGAIQLGPDGQVYIASNDQNFVIQFLPRQDSTQYSVVDLNSNQFALAGGTLSRLGLPNFAQNVSLQGGGPGMIVNAGCIGQPTTMQAIPSSSIDEFIWTYDGQSSTMDSLQYTFNTPGVYDITLRIYNRCLDPILQDTTTVTINTPFFTQPAVPSVALICIGPLDIDVNPTNVPGVNFFWNTGETTSNISVTIPTDYTVTATDPGGCVSDSIISVFDGRPQINLPADFTVCRDDVVPQLDANYPVAGTTYQWTIDGVPASNTRFVPVNTTAAGVFNYRVEVTRGLTGCIGIDSVIVTINDLPASGSPVVDTQPTCNMTNGQLSFTPLSGVSYEWFNNGTLTSLGNSNPLTVASGSYSLVSVDNITGCSITEDATAIDLDVPFTIDPTVDPDCDGNLIEVSFTGPLTTPATYSLVETNTNTITNGVTAAANFSISPLPSGNYNLTVTSADGCTNSILVNIPPNNTVNLTVDPVFDLCLGSNTLLTATTAPGVPVDWFNGIDSLGRGNSFDIGTLGAGSFNITVKARGDGALTCDSTNTTLVNISASPTVIIDPLNPGCDGTASLEAIASGGSGSYSYNWSNGDATPIINVNVNGNYSVDVVDQNTGCPASAGPQVVTISQPLTVTINQDTVACADENLVTLTAVSVPSGTYTYQWFQNNVLLQPQTSVSMQTFTQGDFRVVVSDANNCPNEASRSLARFPITPSDMEPSYLICPAAPLDFDDIERSAIITPGDFVSYFAYQVESGQEIFESNGTYEIDEEGNYNFELGNIYNCYTKDSTVVIVSCEPSVVAPTAFSPEAGIAQNRTFIVFPLFISDFEIFIYNRWGELIYHTDDLDFMENEGWDGTKNGQIQPSGTYAYVMKYRSITDPERGVLEKRGGVNLIR